MVNKTDNSEKILTHPLEHTFGITPGSTMINSETTTMISTNTDDSSSQQASEIEDKEIDSKLEQIYDAAMETFQNQTDMVEIIDPKFAARNAEVAGAYLNTALAAVTAKAKIKSERDKNRNALQVAGVINNNQNFVIADRNALLRSIMIVDDGSTIIDQDKIK